MDSKAIASHGKPLRKGVDATEPDARRDRDDFCHGHLVVEADYGLPLGYAVTKASANDSPRRIEQVPPQASYAVRWQAPCACACPMPHASATTRVLARTDPGQRPKNTQTALPTPRPAAQAGSTQMR
ncbi:MAG TPA: hypothetical protein VMZ06_01615 [Candidatus Bathyarchaeia archaeon]|nr:hypothetical protein [Candidatus Bathyarchaeia archaeon]